MYCHRCGSEVPCGASYCSGCGARLSKAQTGDDGPVKTPSASSATPAKNPRPPIARTAMVILVMVLLMTRLVSCVRGCSGAGSDKARVMDVSLHQGGDDGTAALVFADGYDEQARGVVSDMLDAIREGDYPRAASHYLGDPSDLSLEDMSVRPYNTEPFWQAFHEGESESRIASDVQAELRDTLRDFDYEIVKTRAMGNQLTEPTRLEVLVSLNVPFVGRCEQYATTAAYGACGVDFAASLYEVYRQDRGFLRTLMDAYDTARDGYDNAKDDCVACYYATLSLALRDPSLLEHVEDGPYVYLELLRDGGSWKVSELTDCAMYLLWGGSNMKVAEQYLGMSYADVQDATGFNALEVEDTGYEKALADPLVLGRSGGFTAVHDGSIEVEVGQPVFEQADDDVILNASAGVDGNGQTMVTFDVRNNEQTNQSLFLAVNYGDGFYCRGWCPSIGVLVDTNLGRPVFDRSYDESQVKVSMKDKAEEFHDRLSFDLFEADPDFEFAITVSDLLPGEVRHVVFYPAYDEAVREMGAGHAFAIEAYGMTETDQITPRCVIDGDVEVAIDAIYYGRRNDGKTIADENDCLHVHGYVTNHGDETLHDVWPAFAGLNGADEADLSLPGNNGADIIRVPELEPGETAEFDVAILDSDWSIRGIAYLGARVD